MGFLGLASGERKEVHEEPVEVSCRSEEIMRARSDQDVAIWPCPATPPGDDDRADITAPTLHYTITGICSHNEHLGEAAVVRLGPSSSAIRGLEGKHRAGR